MEKHRRHFFLYFLTTAVALVMGLVVLASFKGAHEVSAPTSVAANTPIDLPQEKPKKDEIIEISSPDGEYALTMKNGTETGGTILQSFYITSNDEEAPSKIFTNLSPSDNLLSVPYNTFSPNNKYIFLKYKKSGENKYLVLRTDGKNIQEGKKTVEITELFYEKYPEYTITDITGWGGYSEIVINTNNKEGKAVPSWWFEVPNLSFIHLSTRFN